MERLVLSQTERCWVALCQATRLHFGALLVGSGKTELSRALATAFGVAFVVATEQAPHLVAACAQAGCWLQLQAIDRFELRLLGPERTRTLSDIIKNSSSNSVTSSFSLFFLFSSFSLSQERRMKRRGTLALQLRRFYDALRAKRETFELEGALQRASQVL